MKVLALILLVASSYLVNAQCPAPTGLATSSITATAATATWSPVSGALSYNVDYRPPGYDWITIANATTSLQWSLYGMEANTTYDWRVRANCSSGPSNYTQAQFTTLSVGSCTAPGGLFASNITSSTATVNWSAVSGAFSYSVYYKPSSSSVWITAAAATYNTSYNLYALSSNTTYDWMVYSNCSLTESSAWATSQLTTSGSGGSTPVTSPCPGPSDISTNGSIGGAATISVNTDVKGTISPKYDIDYYAFPISGTGTIAVSLTTLPANYNLAVLNSSGTQVGVSQNNGSQNERINLSVTPGTYYAKVYPKGTANNATSCYTLRVQTVTAARVIATEAGATTVAAEAKMNPVFAVNLYPNPAGDQLNVSLEGSENKAEIKVYNLMGKLVMQQGVGNTITQLNISKLPAGVYLMNVHNGRETKAAKFVKQ